MPPRISGGVVRRDALLRALAQGSPLTLVLGPAGSGKTVLCAMWRKQLAAGGHDVAWYNAAPEDDAQHFAACLGAAFEAIGLPLPDTRSAGTAGLSAADGPSLRAFLAALLDGLHRHPRPVALVVEDFQHVRSAAVVEFFDRLASLAPERLGLVITSRTRPPLNLLPLRVRDQLTEIGFADLRFTLAETTEFLGLQRIGPLSPTQLHTLHQLTDGWPAGLQLAAISLRKAPDLQAHLQRFAQTLTPSREHSLRDYLHECAAEHFDDDELEFLTRTSVCRRFNRELCTHLTGNPHAADMLARFEADNLFVIPIDADADDDPPWYRCHRLLAAYLQERLLARPAEEVAALHRSAGRWFAQRGQYAEAIHHAGAAGDVDLLVEWVERAARPALNGAGFLQLLAWHAQVPRERARHCGELLRCIGWAQVMAGSLEDFDGTLEALKAHPVARAPEVMLEIEMLEAFRRLRVDDTTAVQALLARHLGRPPQARPFDLLLLSNLLAHALIAEDRFEQARDLVRDRPRPAPSTLAARHASPFIDAIVGISFLAQGDARQARAALGATLQDARRLGVAPSAYVACYLAEAHYQLDELQEAEALLGEFESVIEVVGMADSQLRAHCTRASLFAARGDLDAAMAVAERMERQARTQGADRMAAHGLALRVHLEAARREGPAARETLRRLEALARKHGAAGEIALLHGAACAEVARATGQPERARELLEALIARSEARGRLGIATRLQLQAAAVHADLGNRAQALAWVDRALSTAHERGLWRSFIDADAVIADLLRERLQGSIPGPAEAAFARAVLQRLAGHAAVVPQDPPTPEAPAVPPPRPHPGPAPDALSPRETEIVGLLGQALSTKSIARVLDVSAGTVKWHLKKVYAKLGACSREQAVLRARGLRLIP